MKCAKLMRATGLVALILSISTAAYAASIDLSAIYRGAYKDTGGLGTSGGSSAPTANYFAGFLSLPAFPAFTGEYRNFFVFDLRGVTEAATAATLLLDDNFTCDGAPCGFQGSRSTLTYNLFDVTTPFLDLAQNRGGLSGFADLGSGNLYGTFVATSFNASGTIGVLLNSVALSALNSRIGDFFVIGGAIANLSGTETEGLFGGSGSNDPANTQTQLQLITTPIQPLSEPATLALMVVAVAGLAVTRRRMPDAVASMTDPIGNARACLAYRPDADVEGRSRHTAGVNNGKSLTASPFADRPLT